MKLKFNRDGFSLVELLVVIVLIAILSGVYSILSVQAVNSAEASRIIDNLYSLKNAVLLCIKINKYSFHIVGQSTGNCKYFFTCFPYPVFMVY